MSATSLKPTVLLVEDNEDDVFFLQRALKKGNLSAQLSIVTDGQQAIDYLSGTGRYADRASYPVPSLILLDLKLPYKNGFEVLEWMQSVEEAFTIPVVILSSSPEQRDLDRAQRLGVKWYFVKPPPTELLGLISEVVQK